MNLLKLIKNGHGVFARFWMAIGIALVQFGIIQAQDGETPYYTYNGERIELSVESNTVMVKKPQEAVGVQNNLSEDEAATGVAGWSRKTLGDTSVNAEPDAASAVAKVKAKVAELAADAGTDFVSPVFRTTSGGEMAATTVILVRYREGLDPAAVFASLDRLELVRQEEIGESGIWRIHTDLKDGFAVLDLANELEENGDFEFATVDFLSSGTVDYTPNDTFFNSSWGLENTGQNYGDGSGRVDFDMDAKAAWDITRGSSSIKILILDDGVQLNHPDLNVVGSRNFTSAGGSGGPVSPNDNHGTAVAGSAAALINNGKGGCGVANAGILAAKIYSPNSQGSFYRNDSWVVAAIDWGRTQGARVSNSSWGGGNGSSAIDSAFRVARDAGMIHFGSSGNSNTGTIGYPSSSQYVVSVGASDNHGARASFSNWGSGLEFMAPGVSVVAPDRTGSNGYVDGDYLYFRGTSAASPRAAGVAALLLAREPGLSPSQVLARMRASCTDMHTSGYDTVTGYGMLNMHRLLVPGGGGGNDDHGNDRSSATSVGSPSQTNGAIETGDDDDYFRFVVSQANRVEVQSTSSMDPVGYLYNSSGSLLASNDDAGSSLPNTRDFAMSISLNPGTYYVRVRSFGTGTGNYRLDLSAATSADPDMRIEGINGNSISDGDTTPSASDGTIFSTVDNRGGTAQRAYTVRNTGNAALALNGSPRVALSGQGAGHYRVTVNPVSSVSSGGSSAFTIQYAPTASGSHAATVSIRSNDTESSPYTFAISATASFSEDPDEDDHGNSIYSATRIGRRATVSGSIEGPGDEDYFRLRVRTRRGRKTRLRAFTYGSTDTYGYLMRGSRTVAYNDDSGYDRNFSISKRARRGTYYVRVRGYNPNETTGDYTLYLR